MNVKEVVGPNEISYKGDYGNCVVCIVLCIFARTWDIIKL